MRPKNHTQLIRNLNEILLDSIDKFTASEWVLDKKNNKMVTEPHRKYN